MIVSLMTMIRGKTWMKITVSLVLTFNLAMLVLETFRIYSNDASGYRAGTAKGK